MLQKCKKKKKAFSNRRFIIKPDLKNKNTKKTEEEQMINRLGARGKNRMLENFNWSLGMFLI